MGQLGEGRISLNDDRHPVVRASLFVWGGVRDLAATVTPDTLLRYLGKPVARKWDFIALRKRVGLRTQEGMGKLVVRMVQEDPLDGMSNPGRPAKPQREAIGHNRWRHLKGTRLRTGTCEYHDPAVTDSVADAVSAVLSGASDLETFAQVLRAPKTDGSRTLIYVPFEVLSGLSAARTTDTPFPR